MNRLALSFEGLFETVIASVIAFPVNSRVFVSLTGMLLRFSVGLCLA